MLWYLRSLVKLLHACESVSADKLASAIPAVTSTDFQFGCTPGHTQHVLHCVRQNPAT